MASFELDHADGDYSRRYTVESVRQVLVDISTPAETFERVDVAVTAHFAAHASEFTGKHLVCANNAGDPLKYMLCVWWEYAHPGAHLRSLHTRSSPVSGPACMELISF